MSENEDHGIEIIIMENNSEEMDGKPIVEENLIDCNINYNMSSNLSCIIKYYVEKASTPIVINLGELLQINSCINTKNNIITTDPIPFEFVGDVKLLREFIQEIRLEQGSVFQALSNNHEHIISYAREKNKWVHSYCGVTISLSLTDISIKKFIKEFEKLLNSLNNFYVNHCTAFQNRYLTYMDITSMNG